MKFSNIFIALVLSVLVSASLIIYNAKRSSAQGHPPAKLSIAQATLDNIRFLYIDESKAAQKYLLYAAQADREGFKKVAQLFRAAAESEKVRAASLAKVISSSGTMPETNEITEKIKKTKENLEETINREREEVEKAYPKFLTQAKADNANIAVTIFDSSIKVSSNRITHYKTALNNLTAWKTASAKGFFVCQMCGNLVQGVDFTDCPVCGYPASEYKQVL